jgi:hypothetical protein
MALEDGFGPPTRTRSTRRSTSELLQQLCWTRPRESNPVVAVLRTAAFPLGQVGLSVWHQGKDLNPHDVVQSHASYR